MEQFKIIYKILNILCTGMEYEEFDNTWISAEALGVSVAMWEAIMKMLVDNDYIEGVIATEKMYGNFGIKLIRPRITLKGLEYLEDNSMMKKAASLAKGIADII